MFAFLRSSSVGKNLLILSGTHFIVDFFTGIWPIYKTICGIDIAMAGLIAGLSGFLGESLQIVFGYFCDKGLRKHILLLGLLMSSSILWVTCTSNLFIYFLLLLLLNMGSGSFHPAAVGYAGALTQTHKAKTILMFASAGLFGLGFSQMIFSKVISFHPSYALWLLLPTLAGGLWITLHSFPEEIPSKNFSPRKMFSHFQEKKRTLTLLYITQLCSYGLLLSLIFLLPDILAVKTSHVWLKMGGGHFCFILGGALALPPIGYLCDRHGQRNMITLNLILSLFLFYLLAFTPSLGAVQGALLLFFLGACLSSVNPMIVSWGHRVAPTSPSSVSALLMGLAWCFSHFGPLSAGILYKGFASRPEVWTLFYMGILLVVALGCTLLNSREETETQRA